jgi:hypothetical protein
MHKSALLTAVLVLLGGCAGLAPPQAEVHPEPAPAEQAPAQPAALPAQAAPPTAAPRAAREIRIDNRSIQSFRSSWERLRTSLSPAQQAKLNSAVAGLAFAGYDGVTNLPLNLRNSPIVPEMVRDRIDGLSYSEIIALGP